MLLKGGLHRPPFFEKTMMGQDKDITITFSPSRGSWIENIIKARSAIVNGEKRLCFVMTDSLSPSTTEPLHYVTMSCLIDFIKKNGCQVQLIIKNEQLLNFITKDIRLSSYWMNDGTQEFTEPEPSPYNLWRIDDNSYYNYTIALNHFFQNRYFLGKDLSGLNNCISELFQNVFDHAEACGTAFSFIEYMELEKVINIAVCDFGKGIPTTLSRQYSDPKEALEKSLQQGISAGSQRHNMGFGMHNIISTMTSLDEMRIVSNNVMLYRYNSHNEIYELPFNFGGTLIYMTIHIDSFEDEEILTTFEL